MPINDPVNNRKVAPASLAFERRRTGGGYGSYVFLDDPGDDNLNYQYYIDINFNRYFNQYITKQELGANSEKQMLAMANAERRAKQSVGDYMDSFQWDIKNDWQFMSKVWTPVPFDNEILRAYGAQNLGNSYYNTFSFRPTDANSGVWWVYTHLQVKFLKTADISEARLAFFVNGIQYRQVDLVDHHYMGSPSGIEDCRLAGGCHVPLNTGDKLEVRMYADSPTSEDSGVLYPTSIYGFVTAHRENCDINTVGNTPVTGAGYTFVKGSP